MTNTYYVLHTKVSNNKYFVLYWKRSSIVQLVTFMFCILKNFINHSDFDIQGRGSPGPLI